jgi:cobalt/nickel transport system permease protein
VVTFIAKAQPRLLENQPPAKASVPVRFVVISLLIATIITGGAISWFASAHPDGLEWSMFKTSGSEELDTPDKPIYETLSGLQEATAFLPDYGFKEAAAADGEEAPAESWPVVDAGTTVAGLVGGLLTLIIAFGMGYLLKLKFKPQVPSTV